MNQIMPSFRLFFHVIALIVTISDKLTAEAILRGTVTFLNSGSRPAVGVDVSAFGANTRASNDAGMFELVFPDKRPGDKVKIIIGSKDRDGTPLELVNDKVIAQVRIPSHPDDDIVEIIVCKVGQRNDAALRYNGIIVRTVNDNYEKTLREINQKLAAQGIDAQTIVSLQNEKEKLVAERDSAMARAEEQALFIASINLDKANQLVKEAVQKVDSLRDVSGAIAILDSEMLLKAYGQAKGKMQKARTEIDGIIEAYKLKIKLLQINFQNAELNKSCTEFENICREQNYEAFETDNCFAWAVFFPPVIEKNQIDQLNPTNLQDEEKVLRDAMVSFEAGQIDDAIKKFNKVLDKNPNHQTAQYYLGVSYMSTGQYAKAIELLSPLSKSESFELKNDTLWYLGLCYLKSENGQDKAREAFMTLSKENEYPNHKAAKAILDQLLPKH